MDCVVKYDLATGAAKELSLGPGTSPSELVFVPAGPAAGEDEGWLVGFVYDARRERSDFVVVDASRMAPVARVALPVRVPFGFHGNWVPDA